VSELEQKNERTESEMENLRDLLSRLQEENMQLKKQQQGEQPHSPSQPFTFAMSKDSTATVGKNSKSPLQKDSPSASSIISSAPPQTNFLTPFTASEFDFGSLIPFDPAVLNALDDTYSPLSASEDAMNLDFGFGKPSRQTFNILASDPAYMSFAEPSPPESSSVSTPMNAMNPFDFSALDQWSRSGPRSENGDTMQTFDELFGGSNFLSPSSGIDFAELMKRSPSLLTSTPVSPTNLNGNSDGTSNVDSALSSSSGRLPQD
jgi:AP-1-like factor